MGKKYLGRIPEVEEGWDQVGEYEDDDGVQWLVFFKPQEHTEDWITYKIVANGRAHGKANYWLVRNNKTGQLGFARDFALLREHRPKLHEHVESLFRIA